MRNRATHSVLRQYSRDEHSTRATRGRRQETAPSIHPGIDEGARRDWLFLGAIFAVSLAVYSITCARTVTGEDSGELIAAAYTFGVAHPPGYPIWVILAKAATVLIRQLHPYEVGPGYALNSVVGGELFVESTFVNVVGSALP